VVAPPEQRVNRLVPFVHVEDVERSMAFYYHPGFTVASVYKYKGRPVSAALRSEGAELMVTTHGDPIDPGARVSGSTCARATWLRCAGSCSPPESMPGIVDGTPKPRQELRLVDPEGSSWMESVLMVVTSVITARQWKGSLLRAPSSPARRPNSQAGPQ
jgi:hypothetical protein